MNLYQEFIHRALTTTKTINIIGDCLQDIITHTQIKHNPDTPTLNIQHQHHYPGGAGNIAYCLSKMPIKHKLYGWLDPTATINYQHYNINTEHTKQTPHIPQKQYIYTNNTLTYKLDHDHQLPHTPFTIQDADTHIITDYNKGTLHNTHWLKHIIPQAIIDPKPTAGITQWANCKTLKLNHHEAQTLTQTTNTTQQLHKLKTTTNAHNIIITQAHNGATILTNNKTHHIKPHNTTPHNTTPHNTTGAGDCYIAFLAYATTLNFTPHQAATIANKAASTYITHHPRQPPTLLDFIDNKLITNPTILHPRNFTLTFTNGCFDILHAGHIQLLTKAKQYGDKLIVAINTDESIKQLKGPNRPINTLNNRITQLTALNMIDYIIPFNQQTPLELIQTIKPDTLIKGPPYTTQTTIGSNIVPKTIIIKPTNTLSTTKIHNHQQTNKKQPTK